MARDTVAAHDVAQRTVTPLSQAFGSRRNTRGEVLLEHLTTPPSVVILSNMKAAALVRQRMVLAPDAFAQVNVWRVPTPVPPSEHPFKYRLAYVVGGECVVRYDNERGKGDHRHFNSRETDYPFSTPEQLMLDFNADILRWNHENSRT